MNDERVRDNGDGKVKPKIYLETTLFNFYVDADRGDAYLDTVKLLEVIENENI